MTTEKCLDLLKQIDTTELKYNEIAGRDRRGFSGSFSPPEPRPNLEIFVEQEAPESLTVRMRVSWNTEAMDMRSDAGVVFKWRESRDIDEDTLEEFVRRVGIPYVFPYLRVSLDDLARKFGLADSGIGIIRMDEIDLVRATDPD